VRIPVRPRATALAAAIAAIATTGALLGACHAPPAQGTAPAAGYQVDAIRYGTLPAFPVSGLVAGADSARRLDIAVMVWLLRGSGRTVLVDAGFYRDKFLQRWKPTGFVRPSEAVAAAGVRPEEVTDIVLSHVHWDHMDGVDLFPRARVWLQRAEYAYYVGDDGSARHPGIDPEDAALLARLRAAGRLELVDGDAREILPGITVYTGGRHTYASQFIGVRTPAGTVVVASDNAYLYENLERHAAIAQTFDAQSNLAAQARMLALAASPRLVVPGHDPLVFTRFPRPGGGVARIE
jgi:glyoxylase-like metal-dependent hydrolase (beta-lactamase superfamily II)